MTTSIYDEIHNTLYWKAVEHAKDVIVLRLAKEEIDNLII